jgi:hypothetical protein
VSAINKPNKEDMSVKPKTLLISLMLAASILLGACTIDIHTRVNADGSGTWNIDFVFSQDDIAMLESFGSTVQEFCDEMVEDLPPGARVTLEETDDEARCSMTQTFASLDELRSFYQEDGDGIIIHRLEITGGRFYYDITLDFEDEEDISGLGFFTMNWKLTMPGAVGANNATSVDGNTLTWSLTPGKSERIQAESAAGAFASGPPIGTDGTGEPGSRANWIIIALACLCGLLLLVVIAVAIFLVLRKRKSQNEPAAPAA